MQRKRALISLIMISALIGAFAFPMIVAHASITLVATFDTGGASYTIDAGTFVVSGGNPNGYIDGGTSSTLTDAQVTVDLGGARTVSSVSVDWYKTHGAPYALGVFVTLYDASMTQLAQPIADYYTDPTASWQTASVGSLSVGAVRYMTCRVTASGTTVALNGKLDNCGATFAGDETEDDGWAYPVKTAERAADKNSIYQDTPWISDSGGELHNADDAIASYFYTSVAYSNVYSVYQGTVVGRELLSGLCAEPVESGLPSTCSTFVDPVSGLGYPFRALYYAGAYLLTISLSDGSRVLYVLSSPTVDINDEVTKGCILGKTLGYAEQYPPGSWANSGGGVLMVQFQDATLTSYDARSRLTQEPSGSACAQQNDSCTLVGNPEFTDSSYWADAGLQPQGFTLGPGNRGMQLPGSAYQLIVLDPAQTYYVTASYHLTQLAVYNQTITFTLGNDAGVPWDEQATVYASTGPGIQQSFVSTGRVRDPDYPGNIYNLEIDSTSENVIIDFVCVHADGETPPAPDGGCIFFNPEFDAASGWGGTGAVNGSGIALLDDSETLTQSLTLYPKPDGSNQNYTLEATFRRYPANVSPETLDLTWAWDAQSGTLGTYDTSSFAWEAFTDTIAVDTNPITATITLTADYTSTGVMQIQALCIKTDDGTPPPGYDTPPVQAVCTKCTYTPVGDLVVDFSEFVSWLNCLVLSIWRCQAMTILMGIWKVITDVLVFLGFFRLWLTGSTLHLVYWLGGTIWNLGQTIVNALVGARFGTVVTSGGAGFWDALIAIAQGLTALGTSLISGITGIVTPIIALLQSLVDGLLGVVTIIVLMLSTVIQMIVTFVLGTVTQVMAIFPALISGIFMGLNTGAANVPSLNICDPAHDLNELCGGIQTIDFIFGSGPMALIPWVLMGFLGLDFTLWAVNKYKEAFQ